MNEKIYMLFKEIDAHFLEKSKLKYIEIFAESARQVEGWFKGELLYLFTQLKEQGKLYEWESEAYLPNHGKKKCDFRVTIEGTPVFLELKTMYHGPQRNTIIDLGIFFYKDDIGLWPDVQKLASLKDGIGYCVLFVYPRPELERWETVLKSYAKRIQPVRITEVSDIRDYPPELYIVKIQVHKMG